MLNIWLVHEKTQNQFSEYHMESNQILYFQDSLLLLAKTFLLKYCQDNFFYLDFLILLHHLLYQFFLIPLLSNYLPFVIFKFLIFLKKVRDLAV